VTERPLVTLDHVSKAYRLGRERSNLRAALPGPWGEPTGEDAFFAVDDVSFSVDRGEVVGIIGSNGAGKSTILKMIAGAVAPTTGRIVRPRRFVSIIELGLGFDPDLTGLENLESGAALMGMSPGDLKAKRDEIIDFAELRDFASMPVKRYSTGMLARLGFALATAIEAELYVVDEVLSVGDWGFQRKSLERMRALKQNGATIVFVSHNLWVVNQLCDRAILLDHGKLRADGPTSRVLGIYLGETPFLNDLQTEASPEGTSVEAAESPSMALDRLAETSSTTDGGSGTLPAEVTEDPTTYDWRPVVIHELQCVPDEIEPADPMDLVGVVEVRRAVPGLRMIAGVYWEGFAGFAVPDELPSDFLQTPGWYRFVVHYTTVTGAPAPGTFQIAIVTADEPDDPEQLLPHAVDKKRADMRVVGPITSRPGVYLPRTWELEPITGPAVETTPHAG
jgi:ABC-type polysaccharide/polyol phosphate transport system ATPase subunit